MKAIKLHCKLFVLAILLGWKATGSAQMLGFTVEVDTVFGGPDNLDAFDPAGELEGYTSYLVYANFTNPTDVLSAIYSDVNVYPGSPPLAIDAPCGCYNPETSSMTVTGNTTSAFWAFPPFDMWEYDTFWTIGKLSSDGPGNNPLPVLAIETDGENVCGAVVTNGALFVTANPPPVNAIAGDDLKIVIARVTTCGEFTLTMNAQVFVDGDQNDVQLFGLCDTADEDLDGICDEEDDCVGLYDACGVCNGLGEVYECGCQDIPEGDCDCEGNQLDVVGVCGGDCAVDNDENGICDTQEVYGCTYALADNFQDSATRDDGSCIFPCEGVVNTNVFDWDGDYVVTVTDFLMMLSVYGDTDVDLDGVWDSGDDCVDTNACNYASDPSEPCAFIDVLGVCGGGCEVDEDADGICDDIDTCIGIEDECGVCNGPGPTEIVIDQIITTYDSIFLPVDGEWFVYAVEVDTIFSYECAPFFGNCGDPVSYQGYDYATVLIGDQCWFAENLRSENYENGDAIPSNLSDSEWNSITSGAVAVYGEDAGCNNYSPDIDACDPAQSLNEYGRLYNWYAVDDARGLCPSGWHVPTDGELMTMEMALGMSEAQANSTGLRGTDQGTQMKTDYGWLDGFNGTNTSGFSGLPGGSRDVNGLFNHAGYFGYCWSSSPNGSLAWFRLLVDLNEYVYRDFYDPRYGFSVRCVRDAE